MNQMQLNWKFLPFLFSTTNNAFPHVVGDYFNTITVIFMFLLLFSDFFFNKKNISFDCQPCTFNLKKKKKIVLSMTIKCHN